LFVIGLFNNAAYVMVGAGAEALAETFDRTKLMPLFSL